MKFSAAAFLALLSSVKGDNYEYRGHNVATEDDHDMAICGTDIDGCVALPKSQWKGCFKTQAQFAFTKELFFEEGTKSPAKFYKWIYEDGLLKPKNKPDNWLSFAYSASAKNGLCLGPKSEQLRSGKSSYKLFLQHCPLDHEVARHMRYIMTDDGKVQSLAPVIMEKDVEGDEGANRKLGDDGEQKYCMSTFALEGGQKKNGLFLRPCNTEDERVHQELQAYGTVNTFALGLQDEWGVEDVVKLGYSFAGSDDNDGETFLEIYKTGHEGKVYKTGSPASSGIFEIDVANTLNGVAGEYKAKFQRNGMEHMLTFFIGGEVHFSFEDNMSSYDYTNGESQYNPGILIGAIIAGVFSLVGVGGILFYFIRKLSRAKVAERTKTDDDMTVNADEDDSDTTSQVPSTNQV